MGPEANVLQSALRISSCLLWNVASCLCLSSTQQFSPFPVTAITCNRPGNAELEGVGSVVCQIASKCIQQYSYKEKPYSPRYHRTGMRIGLWNTFIGRQRHFFSEWMVTLTKTDGITHTNFTQWTNNTNHRPTTICSLPVYRGSEWVMTNTATPTTIKTLSHLAFCPQDKEDKL